MTEIIRCLVGFFYYKGRRKKSNGVFMVEATDEAFNMQTAYFINVQTAQKAVER